MVVCFSALGGVSQPLTAHVAKHVLHSVQSCHSQLSSHPEININIPSDSGPLEIIWNLRLALVAVLAVGQCSKPNTGPELFKARLWLMITDQFLRVRAKDNPDQDSSVQAL